MYIILWWYLGTYVYAIDWKSDVKEYRVMPNMEDAWSDIVSRLNHRNVCTCCIPNVITNVHNTLKLFIYGLTYILQYLKKNCDIYCQNLRIKKTSFKVLRSFVNSLYKNLIWDNNKMKIHYYVLSFIKDHTNLKLRTLFVI